MHISLWISLDHIPVAQPGNRPHLFRWLFLEAFGSAGIGAWVDIQKSNMSWQLCEICSIIWVFPKIGWKPQNGWFIMVPNPIKIDDLRVPLFLETPISYHKGNQPWNICWRVKMTARWLQDQSPCSSHQNPHSEVVLRVPGRTDGLWDAVK